MEWVISSGRPNGGIEGLRLRPMADWLVTLRLEISVDPAQQTDDDQEFLMHTQDIVGTWRQEAIQEGIQQGECAVLLRQLRQRFGDAVDAHVERRVATASVDQIAIWTLRILSAPTLAEFFAD